MLQMQALLNVFNILMFRILEQNVKLFKSASIFESFSVLSIFEDVLC